MGKSSRKKQLPKQTKQPVSEIQLSQAILEICKPVLPKQKLKAVELNEFISIAVVAWNITILPKEKQENALIEFMVSDPDMINDLESDIAQMDDPSSFFQKSGLSIGSITLQVISTMIQRKNKLYPNDKRKITHFSVKDSLDGYDIQISSIEPNEQPATVKVAM